MTDLEQRCILLMEDVKASLSRLSNEASAILAALPSTVLEPVERMNLISDILRDASIRLVNVHATTSVNVAQSSASR